MRCRCDGSDFLFFFFGFGWFRWEVNLSVLFLRGSVFVFIKIPLFSVGGLLSF